MLYLPAIHRKSMFTISSAHERVKIISLDVSRVFRKCYTSLYLFILIELQAFPHAIGLQCALYTYTVLY